MIKPHAFLPPPHFEMLRGVYHDLVAKTLEQLRDGTGIPQLCYQTLMTMSLSNGCIALVLDQGDEEARKYFTSASQYALKLLVAPGARGGGLRSYEGNVEVSEDGARLTSLHEKRPAPGSEKLSIVDFHRVLVSVVSFGDRAGLAQVAAVPEDQYRNPGTIASEDQWIHLRAWKALLRGDEAEARREAEAAVAKSKPVEPSRLALVAMLRGDASGFAQSLEGAQGAQEAISEAAEFADGGGLLSLILARVAIDRGMKVEDDVYLPVRLLPNRTVSTTGA